ncbi:MAG: nitroreductase family deazaflavin-dependent oxidoreductase [Nocardioidaceae bacterium]|nr:nitroreductase family deazaflavin-dependent oxidoreductase [Nocardioidaceae bacterium]MCL2612270.1 nitroreductase family deazaflavin-dependent oxidoreductase [Nocardioidaceae bacterium]
MDFNEQMIAAFRANGGDVQEPAAFGRSLILVHVPRKDGSILVRPLRNMPAGDDAWMVAGSAGGSPKDPAWVHSLRRTDRVDIEVPADPEPVLVPVHVEELLDDERDRAWQVFVDAEPGFGEYERKAEGRVIPVFRLTRV